MALEAGNSKHSYICFVILKKDSNTGFDVIIIVHNLVLWILSKQFDFKI